MAHPSFSQKLPCVPESHTVALGKFCSAVLRTMKDAVLSITVVGSAVSTEYMKNVSDINVIIVLADLDLHDLTPVAPHVIKHWKTKHISPRFISRRNLVEAFKYLPIDFWSMQRHHTVLYGQDILAEITIDRGDLLWQLCHELTGLRLRIKQQFWRTFQYPRYARKNLLNDLNALLHLFRVLLYLEDQDIPLSLVELVGLMAARFGIGGDVPVRILCVKQRKLRLKKNEIVPMYENLLSVIREMDATAKRFSA